MNLPSGEFRIIRSRLTIMASQKRISGHLKKPLSEVPNYGYGHIDAGNIKKNKAQSK